MSRLIVIFAIGMGLGAWLPLLPPRSMALILPLLLLLSLRWLTFRLLLALALGLTWSITWGHQQLAQRLPSHLAGEDLWVTGQVVDLPQSDHRRQRFILVPERYEDDAGEELNETLPKRLQVSWYRSDQQVQPGERWRLRVRLRQPRGFVNPGGFDYQAWLLRQGIGATGYVRPSDAHERLATARRGHVDAQRARLQRWVAEGVAHPDAGILQALLVGDRSGIAPERWGLLQRTGTNHLIAISGLHVGFIALLGYSLGLALGRLINLAWHRCPAQLPAHLSATLLALFYAALAGFSLPTQRALIMVVAVQLALLLRRSWRPRDALLLALVAVLVLDPLAPLDMGFWLSFGAVAVLLFGFVGRLRQYRLPGLGLVRAQWLIFVGLLLPLGLLVNSVSLSAPLANSLAIPLVTFTLVPPLLLGALLDLFSPTLGAWALTLASWGLEALLRWLSLLDRWGQGGANPLIAFTPWTAALAGLSALLLLLPRGLPGRALGAAGLLIAVSLPMPPADPLRVTFMDVGQGLAIVVEVEGRALVFDAGPAYSEQFDAGSGIILPYLRQRGVRQIDKLIISHSHSDHAGGASGLMAALPVERLLAGEPDALALGQDAENCHAAEPWRWGEVHFEPLHWRIAANASANNRSCVLLVRYGDQKVLFTGDVEGPAERALLAAGVLPEAVTVLQAPHHGSRSSSTHAFVERTQPQAVVYSAAWQGRFGHPHPEVTERYRATGAQAWDTGAQGAVTARWREPGDPEVWAQRERHRRYWYD
ncbi:DNA internalization-related competence protein ComEC/Rec2 [Marinimicrobium alkaliphilum]|uniref:DNA internalization-related competence protein ComEC/Rec2 n=1 Tax=Marinimicrobium alkaliphilum TaxID=2202654 RepID=UPI000DB982C7|nr:DNA internalization-related competence protein ComEC/Rec2 [Marinimicrobium alkaliphilum]